MGILSQSIIVIPNVEALHATTRDTFDPMGLQKGYRGNVVYDFGATQLLPLDYDRKP